MDQHRIVPYLIGRPSVQVIEILFYTYYITEYDREKDYCRQAH